MFLPMLVGIGVLGCAASASGPGYPGVRPVTTEGYRIVIYRPSTFVNKAAYPNVYVDGELKGTLRNGGYLELDVPPGAHKIKLQRRMTWDGSQEFDVVADSKTTVFYRLGSRLVGVSGVGSSVFVTKGLSLTAAEAELALAELKLLKASQ
jgi:hypothetical protein